jgi:hypothetical protein
MAIVAFCHKSSGQMADMKLEQVLLGCGQNASLGGQKALPRIWGGVKTGARLYGGSLRSLMPAL